MSDLRQAAQMALEALEYASTGNRRPEIIGPAITALKAALGQQRAKPVQETEAFGFVTVRRLSQRFENHHDQYQFYPAGQIPYLDNVDECHTVYTAPPQRKPLTDEQIDAGVKAWFENPIVAGRQPFAKRMRASIEAAHGIQEPKQ